ncbi:MAG: hypothetical protein AAGH92_08945 [Planctomycetota bacterium]
MNSDVEDDRACPGGVWQLAYAERTEHDFDEVKEAVWRYDRKLEAFGLYSVENHVYLFRGHNILYLADVFEDSMRSGYLRTEVNHKPVVALSLTREARRHGRSAVNRFYRDHGVSPGDRALLERLAARAQRLALALQGTLEIMHGVGNPTGGYPPEYLLQQAGIDCYSNVVF